MKRILIVCGTGVATSTVVSNKVRDHCQQQGIPVDIRQAKVSDLLGDSPDVDLVVATTQVPDHVDAPVVGGVPFLTGVGLDKTLDQITKALT